MVDTNVLVRALINPAGPIRPVFAGLEAQRYTLVYSEPLIDELLDVLSRPRISTKYGHAYDATVVRRLFVLHGVRVVPGRAITACRDPKDNMVLEAAVAGEADVIVGADNDLLVLHPFEGIPIVGPAAFLALLDRAGPA